MPTCSEIPRSTDLSQLISRSSIALIAALLLAKAGAVEAGQSAREGVRVAQLASATYAIDIPSGDLANALETLARQTGANLVYRPEQVTGIKTTGLKGELTATEAVSRLIKGTSLTLSTNAAGALLIAEPKPSAGLTAPQDANLTSGQQVALAGDETDFRVAQESRAEATAVTGAQSSGPSARDGVPPAGGNSARTSVLEEVVVTAQKREERLQDVPVPVTAISAQTLVDTNQLRLQDYFSSVPGLSLNTDDFGTPLLSIRGLSTGAYTNPTVGVSVDDVPFGSSSALAAGQEVPDLDPSDLARVEVLRGPQGTLYGASSLGGLLKYVTVDPSMQGFSGYVQVGLNSVYNEAQLGYNVRTAANVPVSDDFAIRLSGFDREDPGYIDNPVLGLKGVNKEAVYGGRLSALWKPSANLSLKISALVQRTSIDGSSYVDVGTGLGALQQSDIADTGWFRQTLQAYSAILNAKLGGDVSLTSVTGYNINAYSDSYDYTPILGTCPAGFVCTESLFGVSGTPVVQNQTTRKLTQEVRLNVPFGQTVDWLFGGFFDHEDSPGGEDIFASVPTTGVIVGQSLHVLSPSTFQEYAAFTDLTFHVTDRFDVQLGGRESWDRQISSEIITGPFVPSFYATPSPAVYPRVESDQSAFTYLLTPSWRVSPDLLVYARIASGFRPGGSNGSLGGVGPPTYGPDTTHNYEVGAKGNVLDHVLSFDASVYYIDWKNIQINLTDPRNGGGYIGNGSRAKSEGVELSVEARPFSGFVVSAWVAENNAVLTEAFPSTSPAVGNEGDRLPFSSKISAHAAIQQSFPLGSGWSGYVGGAASYVGNREGNFGTPYSARQGFPGYAKTDVHVGIKRDAWTLNFFVNNLTDRRAPLYGGLGTFNPAAFQFIQPRMIGLSIADSFAK